MAKSSSIGFFTVLKVVLYVLVSIVIIKVVLASNCLASCAKAAPQLIESLSHEHTK